MECILCLAKPPVMEAQTNTPLTEGMRFWWLWSVPYTLIFTGAVLTLEVFGVSGWALGHSGLFILFLLPSLLTSVSSAVWMLVVVYKLIVVRSIQLDTRIGLMLGGSSVSVVWLTYLAKG